MNAQKQQRKINIQVPREEMKGVYANLLRVLHSKEEFCLDFANVFGEQGVLAARVFVSPGHLKRIVRTLAQTLKKYEATWGQIDESGDQPQIGF